MSDSIMAAALELAAAGFRVFPLVGGGKLPAIPDYPNKATTDPAQIRRWWQNDISDDVEQPWNVGIATGRGLVVIDVDVKDGKKGDGSLDFLEDLNGKLPRTLCTETPTGGRHIFLRTKDFNVRNSVETLDTGLDVRGMGGYVVGPGSRIEGHKKPYKLGRDLSLARDRIADCPEWLLGMLNKRAPIEKTTTPAAELDKPEAISRVVNWLQTAAPLAVEGAGGDDTTYRVACRVRDMGVSEGVAVMLMAEHYNERCSPPWTLPELERKVAHPYLYGQNAPGSMSAEADFDAVEPTPATRPDGLSPQPVEPFDPLKIPPRPWIVPKLLLRRCVTVLIAPPGVGKSTFGIALGLSVATGRGEIIGGAVKERTAVWIYNNEDDKDELNRRLAATMQAHRVGWDELRLNNAPALHMNSGTDRPLTMAKRAPDGKALRAADLDPLIAHIKERNIGVLIVDPLVETHEASENDNNEMARVARMFRRIATECNCAVVVVHHTRKTNEADSDAHAGNQDSGRGASSLIGVARVVLTLYTVSQKQAIKLGIRPGDHARFVRIDLAKGNMSPAGGAWYFERKGVPLGYVDDNQDGDWLGEEVGVLMPTAPKSLENGILIPHINAVWPPDKHRLSPYKIRDLLLKTAMYDGATSDLILKNLRAIFEQKPKYDGWIWEMDPPEGAQSYSVTRTRILPEK